MEKFVEKPQDDGEDRGEIRQVHAITHDSIRAGGKTMCLDHSWKKISENELACTNCPTVIICQLDDERLLAF